MNPYFERDAVWVGFHTRFITYAAEALTPQLPPPFQADIEVQVYVETEEPRHLGRADVGIIESNGQGPTALLTAAPLTCTIPDLRRRRVRLPRLIVFDGEERTLVTVLEVLSPFNKRAGRDRRRYLTKRHELLTSAVHFIEIDLLRGRGRRMPLRRLPPCDYCVMVSRAQDRPRAGVWPLRLADPLPTIPIPLRAPSADARLDLQALLHRVYDAGGYARHLERGAGPRPPLTPEQQAWAQTILGGAR
jgi:hypothetical protein